jgi:hypothetical protein
VVPSNQTAANKQLFLTKEIWLPINGYICFDVSWTGKVSLSENNFDIEKNPLSRNIQPIKLEFLPTHESEFTRIASDYLHAGSYQFKFNVTDAPGIQLIQDCRQNSNMMWIFLLC